MRECLLYLANKVQVQNKYSLNKIPCSAQVKSKFGCFLQFVLSWNGFPVGTLHAFAISVMLCPSITEHAHLLSPSLHPVRSSCMFYKTHK